MKGKIDEVLTVCKQALEKCKEVKKKDTENIDVQNVFCYLHFLEGKPISRREIEVNALRLQSKAYVQKIWNKLPDDYTDEKKERGVDEYEESVVKVIKEIDNQKDGKIKNDLSDELVNGACKVILEEIRGFSAGNTRQLTDKRLMIYESGVKIWERLEEESLLEGKTADNLKEELYLYVVGTLKRSVDEKCKDKTKLITICDH